MASLPLEIWISILRYLPFEDIKSCASVCRLVRTAIGMAFPVSEYESATFKLRVYAENLEKQPLHFKWINSWFNAVHLSDLTDSLLLQLCQTFEYSAHKIHTLTLDRCCFSLKNLFCLLSFFPNLKRLSLLSYTSSSSTSTLECVNEGAAFLRSLEIVLPAVSVCSVSIISVLLKSCSNLRTLSLSSFRFFIDHYMQSTLRDTQMISASLLINVVRVSAPTLKVLELTESNATDWMVKSIVQLKELSLRELKLNACPELTVESLTNIVSHQPDIEVLELARCVGICDVRAIVKLKHLRRLNLAKLGVFSQPNWSELKEIEWLSLAHCSFENLPNMFSLCKLKFLDLSGTGTTARQFSRMSQPNQAAHYSLISFTHLRELHLSNCTRLAIAPVFELVNLVVLNLSWNSEVSDALLCQITPKCVGLKELSLRQDRNLSDDGVTHVISHFPSLRILDLALIDRLSDVTLFAIAKSLPRLSNLNISQCSSVTRHGVEAVLLSCKRLRYLNLALCTNLEEKDILKIPKLNNCLQELDLSMNPNVSEVVVEELTRQMIFMRSLKTNYCFTAIA